MQELRRLFERVTVGGKRETYQRREGYYRIAHGSMAMEREFVNKQRAPMYDSSEEEALKDPIDRPTRINESQTISPVNIEIPIYRGSMEVEEFLDWNAEVERFLII